MIDFDSLAKKEAAASEENEKRAIEAVKKEYEAARREVAELERRTTHDIGSVINIYESRERVTENVAEAYEKLAMDIINSELDLTPIMPNIYGCEAGKLSPSNESTKNYWGRYSKDYLTGYSVSGGVLMITLNYSYQNSTQSRDAYSPDVNWEKLEYLLAQRGILMDRILKDGEHEANVFNDVIDVVKLRCVGKILLANNAKLTDETEFLDHGRKNGI